MKTATLSPLEQKIYFAAMDAKDGVIFLDIIESWKLTDKNTLLSTLSKMTKKGWLIRLRKGVYLISKPGSFAIKDAFVVSTYIFPGYNAFSSALYLHRLTDMIPFEIYIATRNENGTKRFGEYTFRAIALKERYGGNERKENIIVSTKAKTFYDCLIHPDLGGGFPQIIQAIYEAKLSEAEWKEFLYYANKYEKSAFFQRLGYLLELLPVKTKAITEVIAICRKKILSKVYLYKRRKGTLDSKWKIVDDVGKEKLLSWWY
jgi:predicted transcriptional regulator of viral defense system